ncbi:MULTISPECIES: biosynthetic-type acetolactate synthase large subunit [Caldilinea]|jgi:acetolactate synthase-1/2/3 large subunit|nr:MULTISPECIES: biosynthetic-type acetolactate synthase large subunit [Caldilinea]GIV72787.1 MAG: acetolactate synthase [Caldilinea sp.]
MPKRNGNTATSSPETPVRMKGAQMVWEALLREGVRVIFGHPGGAILPTYDALAPYEAAGKIHHVLVRHEQCAAHMADGWARATGEVGVCIATSGPGATNLVTGLATAQMDSVPVVAITGQVPTNLLGTDAFQESDVVGVTAPVCKHNYLVTDVNELPLILKEAFYIAREGRPGVVLIDICKDVQNAEGWFRYDFEIDLPGFEPWPQADMEAIRRAAELINKAERPLVLAGHGVQLAGVGRELLQMVERAEIPVVTTLLGAGNIPESHPLSLGMGGMHGEAYANRAVQSCDVLIAMGMRFDDRITGRLDSFAKQAKIIHFEVDKAEVGKNVVPDVAVIGDLAETLPALLPLIEERRHQVWLQEIREWKRDTEQTDILNYEVDELIPPFVIRQLWHATHHVQNGPPIIVTDVGQHQMWECQYFIHDHPGQLITSGGLGTMGFALPAAIGAQMAHPNRLVWAVVGDGGFQMTMQELAVIKQEGDLPVKIAIINNGFLGMVRQWQQLFYEKRYVGTPVWSPDFVKLAEAYQIPALAVTKPEQVMPALEQALSTPGPFLIDFRVKEEVNVYPMVAPGAAVDQLIRRPKPAVMQGYSGVQPSW